MADSCQCVAKTALWCFKDFHFNPPAPQVEPSPSLLFDSLLLVTTLELGNKSLVLALFNLT